MLLDLEVLSLGEQQAAQDCWTMGQRPWGLVIPSHHSMIDIMMKNGIEWVRCPHWGSVEFLHDEKTLDFLDQHHRHLDIKRH